MANARICMNFVLFCMLCEVLCWCVCGHASVDLCPFVEFLVDVLCERLLAAYMRDFSFNFIKVVYGRDCVPSKKEVIYKIFHNNFIHFINLHHLLPVQCKCRCFRLQKIPPKKWGCRKIARTTESPHSNPLKSTCRNPPKRKQM